MRKFFAVFLSVLFLFVSIKPAKAVDTNVWELVFADEFNAPTLDRNVWGTAFPWGARTLTGNAEGQWYTDCTASTCPNFTFQNGIMRIIAKHDNPTSSLQYSSGMIASYKGFSQTYGYFESRMKMPKGKGFWPAFWMLPASGGWPPEIDILESHGDKPTWVQFNTFDMNQGRIPGCSTTSYYTSSPDFTADFHTFAFQWEPNLMIWYVDGAERYRCSGSLNVPMYFVINLAVGGSWPGYPDSSTPFPSYLDVDYFRAYKKRTTPISPTARPTATPTGSSISGDANGDGKVDGIDYIIWLNNYNTNTQLGVSKGDFNKDGKVDGIDYIIWLNNYN